VNEKTPKYGRQREKVMDTNTGESSGYRSQS